MFPTFTPLSLQIFACKFIFLFSCECENRFTLNTYYTLSKKNPPTKDLLSSVPKYIDALSASLRSRLWRVPDLPHDPQVQPRSPRSHQSLERLGERQLRLSRYRLVIGSCQAKPPSPLGYYCTPLLSTITFLAYHILSGPRFLAFDQRRLLCSKVLLGRELDVSR